MFPSLRFMLAAVLSTLIILVIGSGALMSMRRTEVPMVLHPAGSRPLTASWQNDDTRSFEARFAPQAMLINATVQLPPADRAADRPPSRLEFVGSANAAADTAKAIEAPKPTAITIPDTIVAATPIAPEAIEPPVTITPPMIVSPAPEAAPPSIVTPVSVATTAPATSPSVPAVTSAPATDETKPVVVAHVDISVLDTPKLDTAMVIAAIAPVPAPVPAPTPTPAKDPQVATDAPAQPTRKTAAILPAAPDTARPSFIDTSRPEPILKPAIKRRAQIKRPKKRVVRAPAPVVRPAAKPAAPTNPFAALFGTGTTP